MRMDNLQRYGRAILLPISNPGPVPHGVVDSTV